MVTKPYLKGEKITPQRLTLIFRYFPPKDVNGFIFEGLIRGEKKSLKDHGVKKNLILFFSNFNSLSQWKVI